MPKATTSQFETKDSSQSILNKSFDPEYQVLVVEPVEFDPSGSIKRQVTGNLATKITIVGGDTYIGEATIGTAQSSALWRAQKVSVSGGTTTITWAGGSDSFTNIATDLTSLTYS